MKYKYTTSDVATIAMCVALSMVLGKALGIFHRILPFSRGIINAPFFSFMVTLMLYRVRKPGAITLYALGYGLTMARLSIFATMSIAIGGIFADIIISFLLKDYTSELKISILTPIYSTCGIVVTFIITTTFITSSMYNFGGIMAMVISAIAVYAAGFVGSFSAMKLFTGRLEKDVN